MSSVPIDWTCFSREQKHKGREQIPKHVTILWDGICNPFKRSLSPNMLEGSNRTGGGKCRLFHPMSPWRSDERVEPLKNPQNHRVARSFSTKKLSISLRQNGSQQKSLGPLPTEISELPCLAELQFFPFGKVSDQPMCRTAYSRNASMKLTVSFKFQEFGVWTVDRLNKQRGIYLYLTKKHM